MQNNYPAERSSQNLDDMETEKALAKSLSPRQLRLWFLAQYQVDAVSDRSSSISKLTGPLDIPRLRNALDVLLTRHEILRSRFVTFRGRPQCRIDSDIRSALQVTDLSSQTAAVRTETLQQLFAAALTRTFDLVNEQLIVFELVRCAVDEHYLVLVAHPIIADELSMRILIDEIKALYINVDIGTPLASPRSYERVAEEQSHWLSSRDAENMLAYWRQTLIAPLPILQLPTDHPRPPLLALACADVVFDLPQQIETNQSATHNDDRLQVLSLAAFVILLARYSGQDDSLLGIQIAGRRREGDANVVGPFATRLPLRTDLSANPTVTTLLQKVQKALTDLGEHADIPLETIIDELRLERDQSRAPLFQATYALQEICPPQELGAGLTLTEIPVSQQQSEFDLALTLYRSKQQLHGRFTYNKALFDASTIERFAAQYRTLLGSLSNALDQPISELRLLPAAEIEQLVYGWNQSARDFPQHRCAHQLFETQVLATPHAIAIVAGDETLTYSQLNARANRLAHYLRRLGVGPDTVVGICAERSLDMAVGLIGILKAGGAYLPLEPNHPPDRMDYMLSHAQPRMILTQGRYADLFMSRSEPVLYLDRDAAKLDSEATEDPRVSINPDNLVYVIYTSGSTGRPKGVAITQRGLTNYLSWAIDEYRVAEGNGSPVHSPLSFDLTVTSLWTPLLTGKKAILLPDSDAEDALINCLRRERDMSLVKLTPAHVVLLSQVLSPEETAGAANALIIGGEALRGEMLTYWRQHSPKTRLINEYGPTETVVGCCIYEVPEGDCPAGDILIGRPNANAQLYILDRHLNLAPIGVPGELYIGGVGLARGYLNRPDLTAERFVPNPFSESGERLYKTGDLARYKIDGNLEYLGRVDHQVKIRGFRIELGEIEARLLEQPGVKEAVVIVREDLPGGKQLVAYLVLTAVTTIEAVRAQLRERLPDYMIPTLFVQLESLPLNKNGKVERSALPQPDRAHVNESEYQAPQNEIEAVLCKQWEQLLDLPRVGRTDNFFHRGGHSLLAVRLVGLIEQRFKIKLPLASVFRAPTVAELGKLIDTRAWVSAFYSLVPIQTQGKRPALFAIHTLNLMDMPKHIGTDQPLYFLRFGIAGTVADKPVTLPPLEALASHYIEEMRKVQPQGPYFMMGLSFGGIVAYEMARQLHAQGIRVGLVALLDTYLRMVTRRLPFSRTLDMIRGLSWQELCNRMKRRVNSRIKRAKYGTEYWPHIYTAMPEIASASAYQPQPYPGDVTLFKAESGWNSVFFEHAPPEDLWRQYVQGELHVQIVPGNHTGILEDPYVGTLVSALRKRMDQFLSKRL